ncbi:MAG: hypothetical protein V3T60_13300 [Candidatus Binatia bacterium]
MPNLFVHVNPYGALPPCCQVLLLYTPLRRIRRLTAARQLKADKYELAGLNIRARKP